MLWFISWAGFVPANMLAGTKPAQHPQIIALPIAEEGISTFFLPKSY